MTRYYVTFRQDDDIECATLGSCGLSTLAIAEKTGLSPSQVMYRLRKASIQRKEFRNGSGVAWRLFTKVVAPRVRGVLKQSLPQRFDLKGRVINGKT